MTITVIKTDGSIRQYRSADAENDKISITYTEQVAGPDIPQIGPDTVDLSPSEVASITVTQE